MRSVFWYKIPLGKRQVTKSKRHILNMTVFLKYNLPSWRQKLRHEVIPSQCIATCIKCTPLTSPAATPALITIAMSLCLAFIHCVWILMACPLTLLFLSLYIVCWLRCLRNAFHSASVRWVLFASGLGSSNPSLFPLLSFYLTFCLLFIIF